MEQVAGVYPRVMVEGEMDAGAWSCGMVVGLIRDIPTVQELIDRIMAEAEATHPPAPGRFPRWCRRQGAVPRRCVKGGGRSRGGVGHDKRAFQSNREGRNHVGKKRNGRRIDDGIGGRHGAGGNRWCYRVGNQDRRRVSVQRPCVVDRDGRQGRPRLRSDDQRPRWHQRPQRSIHRARRRLQSAQGRRAGAQTRRG